MNVAHVHLMLTHVPVLGVVFGTALLAAGIARKNRVLEQAALTVLVLAGLAAGVAYWTGGSAEDAIERQLAGGQTFIERHEEAGLVGLVTAAITAAIALITLVIGRHGRPFSHRLVGTTLLVALVASGALAWVANLGGQISHPEARSGQTPTLHVGDRAEQED